ncbi:hypothetical protein OG440_05830 [Streptomyces sp. NBC_00637]|uniref:hypothetical protein n=1 Tax=Streptomyces sp. NBC_00637 TaxID=2903667 RepID=UPI00324AE957
MAQALLTGRRGRPAPSSSAHSIGVVPAAAGLAERTALLADHPLDRVSDPLVAHPFLVAAALAAVAAAAWAVPGLRTTETGITADLGALEPPLAVSEAGETGETGRPRT